MSPDIRIVVLPGDGIGPEVTAEAVKVLRAIEDSLSGMAFQFEEHAAGAQCYLDRGTDLPDATWDATWKAYWAVKDATAASLKDSADVKAQKQAALTAYEGIQKRVAEALRRDSLSVGAWLMGFFGASLLWGGFAFCVGVARKAAKD